MIKILDRSISAVLGYDQIAKHVARKQDIIVTAEGVWQIIDTERVGKGFCRKLTVAAAVITVKREPCCIDGVLTLTVTEQVIRSLRESVRIFQTYDLVLTRDFLILLHYLNILSRDSYQEPHAQRQKCCHDGENDQHAVSRALILLMPVPLLQVIEINA